MKKFFITLLIAIFVGSTVYFVANSYGRKCSPKGKCTACKNCSSCKNCAKEGGTCSVCK